MWSKGKKAVLTELLKGDIIGCDKPHGSTGLRNAIAKINMFIVTTAHSAYATRIVPLYSKFIKEQGTKIKDLEKFRCTRTKHLWYKISAQHGKSWYYLVNRADPSDDKMEDLIL